jgi:hypothetical protein
MRRAGLSSLLAATAVALVAATPAPASVTIGSNLASLHAHNMPGCNISCTATNLHIPFANRAAGGLTSPVNGTVTSWRVRANTGLNLSLRILRPVGGLTYTGVGTSAPASFPGPGISPSFPTSLPINIGDSIGLDNPNANLILGAVPGAVQLFWNVPPLLDGVSRAPTGAGASREVLVQAVVEPTNTLTFGKVRRNKKKGVAFLPVNVPNPGELTFSGKLLKIAGGASASQAVSGPGQVTVKVTAKKKKAKKLKRKGKVRVKPIFEFTPTSGLTSTQAARFGLKRKVKRK